MQRVFDSSPAQRSGMRQGEVITAVDGRSLQRGRNRSGPEADHGSPRHDVHLTLSDGKGSRTVTVTREVITEPVVASAVYTVHGDRLGWVYLAQFSEGAQEQVRRPSSSSWPSTSRVSCSTCEATAGSRQRSPTGRLGVHQVRGDRDDERRTQPTDTIMAAGNAIAPTIPMVVLVDHDTASASEIVTAAFQDHHRATVVGTHTYGKGVFQELEPLSNGAALKVTVGEYFTPNGRNLGGRGVSQGAGVTPEVPVNQGIDTDHGLNVALLTLANKIG